MTPLELIITLAGSVFGSSVLGSLITGFMGRRKTSADASQVLVDATLKWASSMAERIKTLEEHLSERERVIEELQARITALEQQIGALIGGKTFKGDI